MSQELSNEIISAEIVFSKKNDLSKIQFSNEEYNRELSLINSKLEKYTNHADRYDYMVAVASGIICGVLDAQVADVSLNVMKDQKISDKLAEIAKATIKKQEKCRDKNSISGLLISILSAFMNKKADGVLTENDDSIEFDPAKAVQIFGGAAVTAMMKWLTMPRASEEIENSDFPEVIKTILKQINNHPKVREILKDQKIPDLTPKNLEKWGVPAVFISLVQPKLSEVNKNLRKVKESPNNMIKNNLSKLDKVRVDKKFLGKLGRQTIGVVANELIVRGFYFIRHLMMEMDRCGDFELVDWNRVIPLDNRTVTRMLSVASLTFTAADMTSAAIRAAVESCGDASIFAAKYAANINVIGVGRAIIAVTRDVSMEWQEADLIRERRELMEKISAEQVDAILAYRKQMEDVVEEYLAQDLQAFLTGAEEIESGLTENDSDQVIHGNVTIQRVLGRKPQFSNQTEFDDLMDSMDALIL